MSQAIIGIDLGGTRIKAVAMDTGGTLLHQLYMPTHDKNDQPWKKAVSAAVNEMSVRLGLAIRSIGISAPGLPDADNKSIAYMPGRMDGLENYVWEDHLGYPAWVLNDAVAALLAEARTGTAKDKKHVVMLTLGTGVGGAILIDGKPYQGAFNKAGHIGHMAINDEGDPDITGMPGSLETCIGNCTILQRSKGIYTSTHDLLIACRAGDEFARKVWTTSVRQLAVGLAGVTNVLSPELIVLGGGITEAGEELFEPLKKYMAQYEWRAGGNQVEIVRATHGDLAGAIGAGFYAMEKEIA